MSDILSARRFNLISAHEAKRRGEGALWHALLAEQRAQPGTPLLSTFPSYAKLVAAQYTALEDLAGADVAELRKIVGLSLSEASAVLAAIGS